MLSKTYSRALIGRLKQNTKLTLSPHVEATITDKSAKRYNIPYTGFRRSWAQINNIWNWSNYARNQARFPEYSRKLIIVWSLLFSCLIFTLVSVAAYWQSPFLTNYYIFCEHIANIKLSKYRFYKNLIDILLLGSVFDVSLSQIC